MKLNEITIEAKSLKKRFGRNKLFKDVSFSLGVGDSLSITGPNGSGKSTLLKIIAGLQSPTGGNVNYRSGEEIFQPVDLIDLIGFTSPLINPYDDLTGMENINFIMKEKKEGPVIAMLEKFNLAEHKDKKVRFYSSGMKQRLKLIITLLNDPLILLLDEPGTNMDRKGKDEIYSYLELIRKEKLIIIATNDKEEENLCREGLSLA